MIGMLDPKSAGVSTHYIDAFRQGLKEGGFVEGRNVWDRVRWAEGRYDELPAMAADLVHRQVAVIAAISPSAAVAAKSATATIPIVFQSGSDPVSLAWLLDLSNQHRRQHHRHQPAGNGASAKAPGVAARSDAESRQHGVAHKSEKRERRGREPRGATRCALAQVQRTSGPKCYDRNRNRRCLRKHETATSERIVDRAGCLFFNNQVQQLAALALDDGVPAIYSLREFAAAGGLMSYGQLFCGSIPSGRGLCQPYPQGRETK